MGGVGPVVWYGATCFRIVTDSTSDRWWLIKNTFFEWSPLWTHWHTDISSDILTYHLEVIIYSLFVLTFYLTMSEYIWHFLWHILWLSIWHSDILSGIPSGILSGIFGDSITLIQKLLFGSGGDHCDHELAVEVRRGSLWSRGCCSGPAGATTITSLQLRFGGDIKSNNPHLTGGE